MALKFSQGAIAFIVSISSLSILHTAQAESFNRLGNGTYQMCSEPAPKAWQQGAGVCLVFTKQNDRIEGYYGYPHSDDFVCLQGTSNNSQLTGKGYIAVWEGDRWETIPQSLIWDKEQRLRLEQSQRIRNKQHPETERILFQKATLNVQSFYLYETAKMTSPKQLCDWSFKRSVI